MRSLVIVFDQIALDSDRTERQINQRVAEQAKEGRKGEKERSLTQNQPKPISSSLPLPFSRIR